MPSRLVTAGILLFWLTMTGWLIEREVVPMMIADASPSYRIDLTDEIGSPQVAWHVLSDGKRIGGAISQIVVNDDRSFEFHSKYSFDRLSLGPVKFKLATSVIRVSEDGKLLAISARFGLQHDTVLELKGEVVNNILEPHLYRDGSEWKLIDLGKIDLSRQGSVVNPMHLMSRLRGLRAGQSWRIHRLDPLSGVQNQLVNQLGKQGVAVPTLIAEVKLDTLHWNRKEVPCHKIEYYEPGKEVTARTWVRKLDGLVLQQEASHLGTEMITQRIPE
jgi:hypothetical protein